MKGTLVSSWDIVVAGLTGREFTATDPEGSEVTARVLLGGSRVYTIAGTYPKGTIPASIQRFLDSFEPGTISAAPAGTSVMEQPPSR